MIACVCSCFRVHQLRLECLFMQMCTPSLLVAVVVRMAVICLLWCTRNPGPMHFMQHVDPLNLHVALLVLQIMHHTWVASHTSGNRCEFNDVLKPPA